MFDFDLKIAGMSESEQYKSDFGPKCIDSLTSERNKSDFDLKIGGNDGNSNKVMMR